MSLLGEANLNKIIDFIENEFADIRCQSAWDFSGRQIYLGDSTIKKICLALDPSLEVIRQAADRGCELLITHHPLFFRPVKGLSISKPVDNAVIEAIRNNLSILSYHTNLDMAPDGLNSYMLKLLGARDAGMLSEEGAVKYVKLEVFTPQSHEQAVLDALDNAGAGRIGNYRRCAFSAEGTGTFTPLDGANPYIGSAGKTEYVKEIKQEMILPADMADKAVEAMKAVHPYEVPAYNLIDINSPVPFGIGRLGEFESAVSCDNFIKLIKNRLNISSLRVNKSGINGDVRRFAVCTGSGGDLWKKCLNHGVDVLITGDLKHHDAIDARDAGVWVIDAGHFSTEKIYMGYFAEILKSRFGVEIFIADENPTIITI